MDETSLGANREFKVLRDNDCLPITIEEEKMPHLTACVCFNATGYVIKPMIIVPNLSKPKSLSEFQNECVFTTSATGWMTKPLFLAFVIHFISEIMKYRLQLPEKLKEQKVMLIVDGHSSRYTPEALILLKNSILTCLSSRHIARIVYNHLMLLLLLH